MVTFTYKALGFFFLALALAGTILPLLPTTPFLLVAAACFAKSSDKWHQRLLSHPKLGPLIGNWQEHRCISQPSKIIALVCIVLFGGYSVFVAIDALPLQVLAGLLVCVGFIVVSRLGVCEK